jgi:hypothetical protein
MLATDIFGLPVPAAGPVFFAALTVHILAAITCIAAGLLAATARKRPGRHPRSGRVYLCALGAVFVTATVMAAVRWRHDAHLFAIATVAFALGLFGWRFRPSRRPGRQRLHAIGMGGSFIALFTGFYVDNGPHLPLWRLLPHWTYWLIPSAIGIPLIWWALRRFRTGASSAPRQAETSPDRPHPATPHQTRSRS